MKDEINVNEMCMAWYPKNKSMGHDLDLFFFMPEKIGDEYAAGQLYFGNTVDKLTPKCKVRDVCVADLRPLDSGDVQKMDEYSSECHRNAIDLGFQHVRGYVYKIPSDWVAGVGINVDLSQSGKTQHQILRHTGQQLASKIARLMINQCECNIDHEDIKKSNQ